MSTTQAGCNFHNMNSLHVNGVCYEKHDALFFPSQSFINTGKVN